MKPIYTDLHIHTSENPNQLNEEYNVDLLLSKISEVSANSDFLISLTDHNTINKLAYMKLLEKTKNVVLGVELHIFNYDNKPLYHCHIFFNIDNITEAEIDDINEILDNLYPNKIIDGDDDFKLNIETIIRNFDNYDFILLPHGGQNHKQFHKSISTETGVRYDSILERNIYYNQFDGFTARNERGLQDTLEYFDRLGIREFINLVTCTDNYNPSNYPSAKDPNASEFIPTWIYSQPTFSGLRLALSESSRMVYSKEPPQHWSEFISEVKLNNEFIDIDVMLSPGLNVVIGGSSSGKTLFVDSVFRKLNNSEINIIYEKFSVNDIEIRNPSGLVPHYIDQNYIIQLIHENSKKDIDDIPIIKKVFPGNTEIIAKVRDALIGLKQDLDSLIDSIENIESIQHDFKQIPVISRLVLTEKIKHNVFSLLLPSSNTIRKIEYPELTYQKHLNNLTSIKSFIEENPFIEIDESIFNELEEKLLKAYNISISENIIRGKINDYKEEFDRNLSLENQKHQSKKLDFERLINKVSEYKRQLDIFYNTLEKISKYSIKCKTEKEKVMDHELFIENDFQLTKDKFLEVLNIYLKANNRINSFKEISPENLYIDKFRKQNPKIQSYDDFKSKIYHEFDKLNKIKYRITTASGKNFEELSAGWKTSVILDLILGYLGDTAPLIIDQPEDNLATNYINVGLIKAIKNIKSKKQIILVSHNATIPMLGDAQNIILCESAEKIIIRSEALEGKINSKSVVDYIAEITDGGKPSIKKRVKKYNLKSFRG